MSYTPNPFETTQPTTDKYVESAAAEFRALKSVVNNLYATSNYVGNWASLTGALAAGKTVTHAGTIWFLLTALANVTTSEPGVSADWLNIGNVRRTGDTMTGNLNVPSINGGQLAGMRNKIINGKMEIAQRGTSFSAIASATYSLDRWIYGKSGDVVSTISQETDAPSSNEFQSSLRITVTTADTSIAAGDFQNLSQKIEGYNARDLIGRTFTLSFWVRSAKTGIHCVAFRNGALDRSYVAEYTISAANTWEFKTVTVRGGLITSGTWNWTNGAGLVVDFPSAAGANLQSTPNAWQTGNFVATANQVNCLDTVGNIFAITGVQLEVGEVATPFEHRDWGLELQLCYRYYEKINAVDGFDGNAGSDITIKKAAYFKSIKRAVPACAIAASAFTNGSTPSIGEVWMDSVEWRYQITSGASVISRRAAVIINAAAEL